MLRSDTCLIFEISPPSVNSFVFLGAVRLFKVLTVSVIGGVARRSFVDGSQCFRGKYCLHLQGVMLPLPPFCSADCSITFFTFRHRVSCI